MSFFSLSTNQITRKRATVKRTGEYEDCFCCRPEIMISSHQQNANQSTKENKKPMRKRTVFKSHTKTRKKQMNLLMILTVLAVANATLVPVWNLINSGTNMCGGCYKDLYGGSYLSRTSNGPVQDSSCCPASGCSFGSIQQLSLSTCESLCIQEPNCQFVTFIDQPNTGGYAICELQLVTSCSYVSTGTSMVGEIYQLQYVKKTNPPTSLAPTLRPSNTEQLTSHL